MMNPLDEYYTLAPSPPSQSLPPPPPPPPPPSQESVTLPPPLPLQDNCILPPPPAAEPPPPPAMESTLSDDYDPFNDDSNAIVPESITPPIEIDPKMALENLRAKEEKERAKHTQRIAAENSKKRKLTSGKKFGNGLKKVISIFSEESDTAEDGGGKNDTSASGEVLALHHEPAVDDAQFEIILKTSAFIFDNPDKVSDLKQSVKGNAAFDFLFNAQSPGGVQFDLEMKKLLKHRQSSFSLQPPPPPPMAVTIPYPAPAPASAPAPAYVTPSLYVPPPPALQQQQQQFPPPTQAAVASTSTAVTGTDVDSTERESTSSKRKSRWGPAVKKEQPSPSHQPLAQPPAQLQGQTQALALAQPPRRDAPPPGTVTDPKLLRQLQEQKELQMLEKRIRDAAAAQLMHPSRTGEGDHSQLLLRDRLAHYQELALLDDDSARRDTIEDAEDNDGVIEDGTWEHRKRAKEMLSTALKSETSTLLAAHKHHISDFLPKAEMDRFLKKAGGESVAVADEELYADKKLDGSNIGYQLLERGGWTAGSGLGSASGSGGSNSIVNPISATQSSAGVTGAGVGVKPEHELAEGDDEFDSYRKRMMLSYRFRPNPLNNPRRDYY